MLIQRYNLHDKINKRGTLDVPQQSFDDIRLRLYKRKHLINHEQNRAEGTPENPEKPTFSGHLRMKPKLILTKWEAMTMRVFISSGDLSRTNSQKGARTTSALPTHVADMDQMSLQRTSVATYGYLETDE